MSENYKSELLIIWSRIMLLINRLTFITTVSIIVKIIILIPTFVYVGISCILSLTEITTWFLLFHTHLNDHSIETLE